METLPSWSFELNGRIKLISLAPRRARPSICDIRVLVSRKKLPHGSTARFLFCGLSNLFAQCFLPMAQKLQTNLPPSYPLSYNNFIFIVLSPVLSAYLRCARYAHLLNIYINPIQFLKRKSKIWNTHFENLTFHPVRQRPLLALLIVHF